MTAGGGLPARIHMVLANTDEPLTTLEIAAAVGLPSPADNQLVWRVLDGLARTGHVRRITVPGHSVRSWIRTLPGPATGPGGEVGASRDEAAIDASAQTAAAYGLTGPALTALPPVLGLVLVLLVGRFDDPARRVLRDRRDPQQRASVDRALCAAAEAFAHRWTGLSEQDAPWWHGWRGGAVDALRTLLGPVLTIRSRPDGTTTALHLDGPGAMRVLRSHLTARPPDTALAAFDALVAGLRADRSARALAVCELWFEQPGATAQLRISIQTLMGA